MYQRQELCYECRVAIRGVPHGCWLVASMSLHFIGCECLAVNPKKFENSILVFGFLCSEQLARHHNIATTTELAAPNCGYLLHFPTIWYKWGMFSYLLFVLDMMMVFVILCYSFLINFLVHLWFIFCHVVFFFSRFSLALQRPTPFPNWKAHICTL